MSDKFTTARLSKGQDRFEILVKPQPALEYKLGKPISISQVLMIEEVYSDSGKGTRASEEKLQKNFGTTDAVKVAEEIMKSGELQLTTEQRRQLIEDEKRLRDNLAAVGRDTALYKQTLDKLGETEALITTLSTHIATAAAEIETAKEQLQNFISALTL